MSNEELLYAIRNVMEEVMEEKLEQKLEVKLEEKLEEKLDKKFKENLAPVYKEISDIKSELSAVKLDVRNLQLDSENVIKPQLQLRAENYVSAAKKFEKSADEMERMQFDIEILKKVVANHSEILQKIS